ncbi:hypothetical protein Mal15_43250 [Stieleria maiorica]|uniref:Planctomycete cytochrome C n=1 Tax=Stieleria maiorica TaxID=2795974 RepID=A0A5B9MKR0_9BACT|nr:DUF1592 domain-containing protein [Stieleria maiorica]QEG00255.1 hypothetical protein Mal15_43250 [Stieleria maiorica]
MNRYFSYLILALAASVAMPCHADLSLIKQHCSKCHTGPEPKGDFSLHDLRSSADAENVDHWVSCLERVEAGEMPPAKHNRMTDEEKSALNAFLRKQITRYESQIQRPNQTPPRRLNNREFENSLCDVLLIDHVGTHDPLANLLGDTLHDGFDTHGETLGMSEFHLDQYVTAVRQVLDNVVFTGDRPASERSRNGPKQLQVVDTSNRSRADRTSRSDEGVDIRDTRQRIYCKNFVRAPHSGNYRITVRAKALDRHVYRQDQTGIHDDDPLTLRMHLGNGNIDFNLHEGELQEFESNLWLAEGTPLEFSHHTDGLRMIGNGNFKFQYRIAHDYLKEADPQLYERVVTEEVPKSKFRRDNPSHWSHWVDYWQGPRPLIASVTIEGPLYESWPPQRHVALIGQKPDVKDAATILAPIAERAWRRDVTKTELEPIVALVQSQQESLGDVGAIKEGIVAVLASPSFLMLNPEQSSPHNLFATKLSYLLGSTAPDQTLIGKAKDGRLASFDAVREELKRRLESHQADEFLREFPYAWLQLDRINFMAPDVDRYPLYEKKAISEDMVREVLAFFRHAVEHNRPLPELLTADYSFVNADLAKVYELENVPSDSVHRKYVFDDGRRGGFLGMGAFLTLTADTLNTSPIHRAIYVMENFMGIHPAPPPADVEIKEPDIRSATTIREVLEAHQSDATCAACHQNIDPFGYAFENFDPIGAWRDEYIDVSQSVDPSGPPGKRKQFFSAIPIDASATFLSGAQYQDITDFRELMKSDVNQKRFVRCFITKLLTYANGIEPENFTEVEAIVRQSADHDYRIVETIAAVVDSPLFRETNARGSD